MRTYFKKREGRKKGGGEKEKGGHRMVTKTGSKGTIKLLI